MASFSRKTRIIGALVIAGVLIVGSYILASGNLTFFEPSTANAESTQALLQAFAARSHDGLPDWEAELYGLDPNNPHSYSPTITNAQAIQEGLIQPKFLSATYNASSSPATDTDISGIAAAPDSLTTQFSQYLLNQYLSQSANEGGDAQMSDTDITTMAQNAMQSFAQNNEHQDPYSLTQVQVSGSGPNALKAYAASTDAVFEANDPHTTESEIEYFSAAIENNDPVALAKVSTIGKDYTAIAPAFMELQVPVEAQYAHLEIANAMSRLGEDITDLSAMNTDPLRAYLGLVQYQIDSAALTKGFSDLGAVFSDEQISIQYGDPGYFFYKLATGVSSSAQN